MDFSTRNQQQKTDARPATPAGTSPSPFGDAPKPSDNKVTNVSIKRSKPLFVLTVLLSVSLLVLAIVTILGIANRPSEEAYVNEDKFQAVFLDGGQVYFGSITELNNRYLTLENIFYLNVSNSTVQPDTQNTANQQISLVKLGCELHGPDDSMVINRDKVQFWENLKADGKVTAAINTWAKENPDGQKCDTTINENAPDTTTNNNDAANTDDAANNDNTNDTNP